MHEGRTEAAEDEQTFALALRLAEAMRATRGTSSFAVETFVRAIEDGDVIGAVLEMRYRKKDGRVEATVHVGPDVLE